MEITRHFFTSVLRRFVMLVIALCLQNIHFHTVPNGTKYKVSPAIHLNYPICLISGLLEYFSNFLQEVGKKMSPLPNFLKVWMYPQNNNSLESTLTLP